MRTDTADMKTGRPTGITAAAVLLAAQGVLITGWGIASLASVFLGQSDGWTPAVTLGFTVVLLAVLPLVAARGLWLLRRWSRGPAVVVQLMALPVAWPLVRNGDLWTVGGIALGGTAVTALLLLLRPSAAEALGLGPRNA